MRHIDHCQLMIGLEFQHIHTLTHYVCLGLVNPFPCSLHLLALHSLIQIVFDNTAVSGAIPVEVMAEPTVFDCNANQKNDQLECGCNCVHVLPVMSIENEVCNLPQVLVHLSLLHPTQVMMCLGDTCPWTYVCLSQSWCTPSCSYMLNH